MFTRKIRIAARASRQRGGIPARRHARAPDATGSVLRILSRWAFWALPCCTAVCLPPVLGPASVMAASSVHASTARSTTFCVRPPARGQITLVPQPRDAPPLVRFVVRGLPARTILGLFVDQGQDRSAYNITFGVRSDLAGSLVRTVDAFRRPEKAPRRLLLESWNGRALLINAIAYPCRACPPTWSGKTTSDERPKCVGYRSACERRRHVPTLG